MGSPRAPIRQACDPCRLRKIKCRPSDHDDGVENAHKKPCKPCSGGNLECTYILPVKRRGPPPKQRRVVMDRDVAHQDISSVAVDQTPSNSSPRRPNPMSVRSIIDPPTNDSFTIRTICSFAVFDALMQDYMAIIYPLVPVVHRPTFRNDLRNQRHMHDEVFKSFCLAICALVLGILPRKFDQYRQIDGSLAFANRKAAVTTIHSLILKNRPVDYFDTITLEKWAISYMIGTTSAHLQLRTRARVQFGETDTLCTELGLNRIASYTCLDLIQTQLRKKAFWLTFTTYSHVRSHEIHWDSFSDRFIFETADADALMPLDVDDEYITAEQVYPQPLGQTSLTAGFNALNYINNCMVTIIRDPAIPLLSCVEPVDDSKLVLETCACGRHVQAASLSSLVQARLEKTRYVLNYLPVELRPWPNLSVTSPEKPSEDTVSYSQFESMKANIHVTHLWAQSLMLERLTACHPTASSGSTTEDDARSQWIWAMREDICRQLLHLLNNISQANLEPNGYFLILKTREVAASLLDRPIYGDDHVSLRAKAYIQSFADILARVDYSYQNDYKQNLWEELDEQAREPPSSFWNVHG